MADIRLLPGPVVDEWDWQLHGACRGMDSSFFFHPDGERGPRREQRAAQAKKVCARCPVLEPCRRHALATREPYGVWGGLTEDERRAALRAHRNAAALPDAPLPETVLPRTGAAPDGDAGTDPGAGVVLDLG